MEKIIMRIECPFCKESIKETSKRCPTCGSWIKKKSYYFYCETIVIYIGVAITIIASSVAVYSAFSAYSIERNVSNLQLDFFKQHEDILWSNIEKSIEEMRSFEKDNKFIEEHGTWDKYKDFHTKQAEMVASNINQNIQRYLVFLKTNKDLTNKYKKYLQVRDVPKLNNNAFMIVSISIINDAQKHFKGSFEDWSQTKKYLLNQKKQFRDNIEKLMEIINT